MVRKRVVIVFETLSQRRTVKNVMVEFQAQIKMWDLQNMMQEC
jgi:hypothetical protein